jgi:hypothetical protein
MRRTCAGWVHYGNVERPCRASVREGETLCRKHAATRNAPVRTDDLYFLLYHALCGIESLPMRSVGDLDRIHALVDEYASYLPPQLVRTLAPELRDLRPEDTSSKEAIHDPLTFFLDNSRAGE